MASYTNQTHGEGIGPKITLYTNHGCPYAHRAHIALNELKLPFEEVIIDLDKPREPWYLEINPRGLVPSIKYNNGVLDDEIITESAIVAQFLADSRPSHLLPASLSSPDAPLVRARIAFFQDTWNTKIASFFFPAMRASSMAEKEEQCSAWVKAIEKEIEPLLKDANPFFGGSNEMTLAEVHTAPFLLRFYAMSDGELLPKSLKEGLEKLPHFGKWAKAVMERESVLGIWDEEVVVRRTKERMEKMKAQGK